MTDIALEDRALFDRIAHKYAKKDMVPSTAHARRYQILRAIQPVAEKQGRKLVITDVGCGIGATAKYLGDICQKYIGIDHSEKMIDMAKQVDWHCSFPTEFIADDVKSPSLTTEKADVILAVGALHHMTELDEVLSALKNLAKPGASFIAIEPQRKNPIISLARSIRAAIDSSYSEDQHFFSYDELYDLCERNGLQNIELEYQGFLSKPFGQVILPFEPLAALLSQVSVAIDSVLDKYLPAFLRPLSWDLIVRAEFPKENE